MLDLRLFLGDWCEIELDTETHEVRIRPVLWRAVAPMPGPKTNTHDMVPQVPSDPPAPRPVDTRQRELVEVG
jgi:hypothetical protein